MPVKIEIEMLHSDARMPAKRYNERDGFYDLGWDLFSAETVEIPPFTVGMVKTGLKMRIPREYGVIIKDRSSKSFQHHVVGGVYDASFRGEICINILNFKDNPITIVRGEKFAQMVIIPNIYSEIMAVCDIKPEETERGLGCLGSTNLFTEVG